MRPTLLLAACLLSGCAGIHLPGLHTARRAPAYHPTQPATAHAAATPAATPVTPVKIAQPSPPQPGESIPLMGFRPMRGQGTGS